VKQPLPLPEGVPELAVGQYARVPEPELLYLVLGLMIMRLLVCRYRRRTV
jgi:hypothetical protein